MMSAAGTARGPWGVGLARGKMPYSLQLCSMDGGACVSGTWPDQRLDVIAGGSVNGAIIDQRCVATRSVLSELGGEPAGPERCPISSFTAILNGPARCGSTGVVPSSVDLIRSVRLRCLAEYTRGWCHGSAPTGFMTSPLHCWMRGCTSLTSGLTSPTTKATAGAGPTRPRSSFGTSSTVRVSLYPCSLGGRHAAENAAIL